MVDTAGAQADVDVAGVEDEAEDAEPASITQQITQRLLSGELLTSNQVAEEYSASKSLLGVTIRKLRADGHKFDTVKQGEGRHALLAYKHTGKGRPEPKGPKQPRSTNGSAAHISGVRPGSLIDKVLRVLERNAGDVMTTEEISKKAKISVKQVNGAMNGLLKASEGRLQRVGRGRYLWGPTNLPAVRPDDDVATTNGDVGHEMQIPTPGMYDRMRVQMMALDEDSGILTIAVRNDDTAWLCEVVGVQELAPPARPTRRGRSTSARGRG